MHWSMDFWSCSPRNDKTVMCVHCLCHEKNDIVCIVINWIHFLYDRLRLCWWRVLHSWPKAWNRLNLYFMQKKIFSTVKLSFSYNIFLFNVSHSFKIITQKIFIIESYFINNDNFTKHVEWCQTFGHECIYYYTCDIYGSVMVLQL